MLPDKPVLQQWAVAQTAKAVLARLTNEGRNGAVEAPNGIDSECPEAAEPDPCRCGCVALRIRNAHLVDKVARLETVLAGDGALDDDDTDRERAAQRDWPAWVGHEATDATEPKP